MRRAALVLGATAATALAPVAPAAAAAPPASTVVRMPFPRHDGGLTPYSFQLGYSLMTLVYDTLLWRDAGGVPRPWLARSVTRSRSGRRLTVQMRSGVRWHDGRPLGAADVAFTIRFVARRFHPRFTPPLAPVARVRTPGPRTVVIDLRRPSLGFDDQPLADLPILPAHLWRGLPAGRVAPAGPPVGSGPYRLAESGPLRGYRFRANPAYFRGRPTVERIDVPIVRDAPRTYRALRTRRVDMLPAGLPGRVAERLDESLAIDVARGASYSGTALVLNLRRGPFVRRVARRAVAAALDLRRLTINVRPAAPADRGYLHPASRWASRRVLQRFDPAAARSAFARLRLPDLPVLTPDNDPVRLEAGRQAVLALRRAGAPARLVRSPAAQLDRATGADGSPPRFTAAIVGIPALASYDPDLLGRLFGSRARPAMLNASGYRSDAFDALAERVAGAPGRAARRRAVQAELALLARDLPAVPLFFADGAFAYRPAVYDRWIYVKGLGILDKLSFLRGPARDGRLPAAAREQAGEGRDVLDVLRILSLVAIGAALAVGAAVLRGRARRRGG